MERLGVRGGDESCWTCFLAGRLVLHLFRLIYLSVPILSLIRAYVQSQLMQRELPAGLVVEARADLILYPGILTGTTSADDRARACSARVPVTTGCSRSASVMLRLLPALPLLSQQVHRSG